MVTTDYKIVNTSMEDLGFSYWLFEQAIEYQKKNKYNVWKGYDKEVLQADVQHKRQYKITDGQHILCIFSVCMRDPVIWREKDQGDAIYLHRVVVNPHFKGHKQFARILGWAIDFAKDKGVKFIRMDTWADNPNIIDYYKNFGFKFLENFTTPDSKELALQQRNLSLALLEYPVNQL
jgi:ribosomal protein S18 acetylase RimI-like enzyme